MAFETSIELSDMANNVNPRISFILPFYGVEKFIWQCLESIYHQDIPESEYEVICINDCTPDQSEKIVLSYQKQHANLTLIRHDVNKKLGAARNTGLCAAKGQYVWFIDTDDYIQENCLGEVLSYCETDNLDMLHFAIINNKGEVSRELVSTDVITGVQEEIVSKEQCCIEVTFPWNRVYRRQFLLDNNLFFNDLYGGDVVQTILAINAAQRVRNVNKFYYIYRIDNTSSDTHSAPTADKMYKMYAVLGRAVDDIVPQMHPDWRWMVAECGPWRFNQMWKSILRFPVKEKVTFYRLLHSDKELLLYMLKRANRKSRFVMSHPLLVTMLSPIYNFARILRDKYKHCKQYLKK